MAAGRATEELFHEREVFRREVTHVADTYHLEAALVWSENVVTSRPEDGFLPDLGPSLQVQEPTALEEMVDQVYETVLHEEVHQLLYLWDIRLVEVHIQVPKDDGVLEKFQGLLQVRQVLDH